MLDILTQQVASPVQFMKGLRTLYDAGARMFVEVGPKKALQGFADDVLGGRNDVVSLFTNHPKVGDIVAFNQALCGLYAAGLGRGTAEAVYQPALTTATAFTSSPKENSKPIPAAASVPGSSAAASIGDSNGDRYGDLGRLFADVLDRGYKIYHGQNPASNGAPVVITGAALGLPGTEHIFDDGNIARILRGDQFIDSIPTRFRRAMLDKHITRLVKSDNGEPPSKPSPMSRRSSSWRAAEALSIWRRSSAFPPSEWPLWTVSPNWRSPRASTPCATPASRWSCAIRPLAKGTQLPERWGLPDAMRDDTGVIFASAFPGYDAFAEEMARYYADHERREQLAMLEALLARPIEANGQSVLVQEIDRRIDELHAAIDKEPYVFNRRFLLRVLSMGHSQFAEFVGARGPNTQINSACASATQGVALAEDWIHSGRCKRVIVISADDVTSDNLIGWMGAGFLASGAAATDEVVADAAVPFDRRRHGMIVGMGAAAVVVESADAARERGIQPICEVLTTETGNSAFHGTRLDVQHIGQVMEALVTKAEARSGISRHQIAAQTVFVSHETYTPARGGSASAEIHALRSVFGDVADQIVIANTKGFTGHAMATGIEDVVAIKALETGCVPPVANFKEVDPELGRLNLSKGGAYPVEYAIHLGAGFGSQISMLLLRWVKPKDGIHRSANSLGYAYRIGDAGAWNRWLSSVAGRPAADLEVVHRTLRVRDQVRDQKLAPVAEAAQKSRTASPARATALAPSLDAATQPTPKIQVAAAAPSATPKPAVMGDPKVGSGFDHAFDQKIDPVKEKVLALVADKTGYPVDMLDLDLDLEADLGVDTVKQAEVFAAIREAYSIARDENRKLRDYPTLAHVIRFVYEKRPDLAAATPAVIQQEIKIPTPAIVAVAKTPAPATTSAPVVPGDGVKERILALVVEKTGYPEDMLDLDLDLEADLGVDTVKQAEMFAAIRSAYNIPRDENRKLRDYPTLAHVIRFVYEKRPDLAGAPSAPSSKTSSDPTLSALSAVVAQATPDAATADDAIQQKVLDIVAEKTGYPKEMLDLDLDLEADLGIDTVKQAEMFAAVRAAYNIPRDENLKLRDFPTLASVIKFARDRQPAPAKASVTNSTAVPEEQESVPKKPAASATSSLKPVTTLRPAPASFDAANRIPRRVPVPNLRPPLDLCKPTAVKLGSGQRVIIMPDKAG